MFWKRVENKSRRKSARMRNKGWGRRGREKQEALRGVRRGVVPLLPFR